MSTESDSTVERMLLDDQVALHQSPEPITAILDLMSQNTISPPASSAPVQLQAKPPHAIATLSGLPPLPTTLTTLLPHQPPAQIKNEPREPLLNPQTTPSKPKLGIRHIDLAYHTSKDKMTCRMCFKRAEVTAGWEVKRFPISAPWADLSRHCEQVHPAGYKSLIDLDPATLAETRERLLAMDGQKGKR
ncbi:hypothetical protein PHLGIDRAFT_19149 [Phlebiopsis gigantea 11061_1 CR5-6]|uniref:Uncharacterized protein n=1 Tax=Phlebiopsis gigantea (strain 11061_1 CR5-6) TaxID=745531 RepID=A0A0C3PLX0_PHLG1|nr:hypothetical protein PHLGIDRAFT_19149 [Phlebiopsis gigantea 11061_1 CR5-6]